MMLRLIIFLLINFAALAIGGIFTGDGVSSEWYLNLNKAPWDPPGWVFGTAWTTVMVLFSVYLSIKWNNENQRKSLTTLYIIQWILNVSWNPIFFYFQLPIFGLITIIVLTILLLYIAIKFHDKKSLITLLILPYMIWLFIATSLNAFIVFQN